MRLLRVRCQHHVSNKVETGAVNALMPLIGTSRWQRVRVETNDIDMTEFQKGRYEKPLLQAMMLTGLPKCKELWDFIIHSPSCRQKI